jgi:hypothetical protein
VAADSPPAGPPGPAQPAQLRRADPATQAARGLADRGVVDTGAGRALPGVARVVLLQRPDRTAQAWFLLSGSAEPIGFTLRGLPGLEPGPAEWVFANGTHRLVRDGRALWISTGGYGEYSRIGSMVTRSGGRAPCDVRRAPTLLAEDRPPPAQALAPPATAAAGAASGVRQQPLAGPTPGSGPSGQAGAARYPLTGDWRPLILDLRLRALLRDLLARFAHLEHLPPLAGLTAEWLAVITAANPAAESIVALLAQAWAEYRRSGGTGVDQFWPLAETIVTQWSVGNATVLRNELEIRLGVSGLGLYSRADRLRWYDADGRPVVGYGGVLRDQWYRVFRSPTVLTIPADRRNIYVRALNVQRQVNADAYAELYQVLDGYWRNGEALIAAVRRDWEPWPAVTKCLREQTVPFGFFLGLHAVALVLQRGEARAKAIGAALDVALRITGKFFAVVFAAQALARLFDVGLHLSKVVLDDGSPADSLSQRHLDAAVADVRRLLVEVAAYGITAAALGLANEAGRIVADGGTGGPPAAVVTVGAPVRFQAPAAAAVPAVGGALLPPFVMSGRTDRGRQETGAQQEKRELGEDRPKRWPDSAEYLSREKVKLNGLMKALRAHVNQLVRAGQPNPLPGLNDRPLRQNTLRIILENPKLAAEWTANQERLISRQQTLRLAIREAKGDRVTVKNLTDILTDINAELAEMAKLEQGNLGQKEVDLVEFFLRPGRQRAVVTDITQRPSDWFHNFKTSLYVEAIRLLTGLSDVFGVDFDTLQNQRLLPEPPANPSARIPPRK